MHHAKRFLFLLLLSLTLTSTQSLAAGLTEVVRPDCLYFPKIVDFKNAVKDVHFSIKTAERWCNYKGEKCEYFDYLQIDYKYVTVSTSDFYSANGKLVTTTTSKYSSEIKGYATEELKDDVTEEIWNSAATELRHEISKKIYNDPNGACENSPYQD